MSSSKRKKSHQGEKDKIVFCDITSALNTPCCTILESISDGVFTINPDRQITSFNKAAERITGFKKEEAIGQYCFDVFRANICEGRCVLDETISRGRASINVSALIISKQGDPKPIRLSTSILKNDHGTVIGAVETFRDLSELEELRRLASGRSLPSDIVGKHPKILEIISFLPDVAESESAVLIEGPTGSGKELIARAIHHLSPRGKGPFIALNCAALPDSLLESELFGYVKGAFTGATKSKSGRLKMADGGTLFLDEISTTSSKFQADLLRVLEDGEAFPLGGTHAVGFDVRIVAASNSDLATLVRAGTFRQDLYYRLNVVKIILPALRERKQDIPLLVDHFINKFNLRKERDIKSISPAALDLMMCHPFPGNVRELENFIEYAFITCKENRIDIHHLPKDLFTGAHSAPPHLSKQELQEAETLRAMLDRHSGNRDVTAHAMGISRTTLWRRIKKYEISNPVDET
ncbi:MAG: sigma 54-interacting transcriptional regulator [Deltaproteobacteria bacterium]|nr:sigma 54-interacting transcriptional regulator [Deltaproteobacteria bacterium]MBN2687048.1 sigma 54-interacting transcriptional regulator [Deltaproteobacteria bacterium]